jgi:hypothetical protein
MTSKGRGHRRQSKNANMSNVGLWKRALKFHVQHHVDLLPLLPLLFIPVWTDCYHAILVRQALANDGAIRPLKAIGECARLFPSFALTKFRLLLPACMWAFIPVLGWYKDFQYRLKWAMASNVIVFENDRRAAPMQRCEELAELIIQERRTGALFAVPTLLSAGLMVIVLVATTVLRGSSGLWLGLILGVWIIFPASAMVNTLVYLSITDRDVRVSKAQKTE